MAFREWIRQVLPTPAWRALLRRTTGPTPLLNLLLYLREGTLAGMKAALDATRHRRFIPSWRERMKQLGIRSSHDDALAEFLAHANQLSGHFVTAKNVLHALARMPREDVDAHVQWMDGKAGDREFVKAAMDYVKAQDWPDYEDLDTPNDALREHVGGFSLELQRLRMPAKFRKETKTSRRKGP